MVLNMLSTASMIRMGRIYDNWMIDVALTNQKLRARGLRMLAEASGTTVDEATRALRQSGYNLQVALLMLKTGVNAREAQRRLRAANGSVRAALARQTQTANRSAQRPHG